jgi:hypothetical protein
MMRNLRPSGRLTSLLCAGVVGLAAPAAADAEQRALTLLTDTTATGLDQNTPAEFAAVSEDGARLLFETTDRLDAADTDVNRDVYERTDAGIALVSDDAGDVDQGRDAWFAGASADGVVVAFTTDERLAPTDTDMQRDVYARTATGAVIHVSDNPTGPDAESPVGELRVSRDGTVVFSTRESLAPTDTDDAADLYAYGPSGLRHVSDDDGAVDANVDVVFVDVSADGSRIFFTTPERLSPADTDDAYDVYAHVAGGGVALVSGSPLGLDDARPVYFSGESADGRRMWFTTYQRWAATDTDQNMDVYERTTAGGVVHVSRDPTGVESGIDATFAGATADGSRVFFRTAESMAATDLDTARDVYERTAAGDVVHVSDNPIGPDSASAAELVHVAPGGEAVILTTSERWAPADTDATNDLYRRSSSGELTLVSDGESGVDVDADVAFEAASRDGSRVIFTTREALTASDTDTARRDVYERSETGDLLHLSDNPTGPDADAGAYVRAAVDAGKRVYIGTTERFAASDTDAAEDIYLSSTAPAPPASDPPGRDPPPSDPPARDPPRSDPPRSDPPARAPPGRPGADPRAPVVRALRVVVGRGQVRFVLSERARVRLTLRVAGRAIGRGAVSGRAGLNRVRLPGPRSLRPGRYRLSVVAVDRAGNRSRPRTASFQVPARRAVRGARGDNHPGGAR